MTNKLLSFLGAGKYLEAYYVYNENKTSKPRQFIQEALTELLCKEWTREDKIIILLTETARNKN